MRQIFSIRFFLAVAAVVGLFFVLTTIFATREAIDGDEPADAGPRLRSIDFVDEVRAVSDRSFAVDADGLALSDVELTIDDQRSMRIVAGTPIDEYCDVTIGVGRCAVVADLLGEGVVWAAFVPSGEPGLVELPAIDRLEDGVAVLVNGWQLPYAPILDRRCQDDAGDEVEFSSYREFRSILGDDFTSVYSLEERRLTAVECRTRVAYAPTTTSTTTTTPTVTPTSTSTVTSPVASPVAPTTSPSTTSTP